MKREKKASKFWNWFTSNKLEFENALSNLSNIDEEDLENLMYEFESKLHKYDSEIWFRMGGQNPYELIITAEGEFEKFKDIFFLVESAPRIENWKIIPLIQPQDISEFQYSLDGFELNQDDVFFSYKENLGEDGSYLETMLYVKDEKYIEDEEFKTSIIRIAETSLGEFDFAVIVGIIDIKKTSDNYEQHTSGLLPIYKLPEISKNVKAKI